MAMLNQRVGTHASMLTQKYVCVCIAGHAHRYMRCANVHRRSATTQKIDLYILYMACSCFWHQLERTILSDAKKMSMLCCYPHEACVMCSLLPSANGCDGSETSAAGGATRQTRPKRRGEAVKKARLHGNTNKPLLRSNFAVC